jgi:uncharacterized membrane protein YphA (DoxX/SURF4 family)
MIPEIVFSICRFMLGGVLIVFPLNALFLKLFSPKIPERGAALMNAMRESGYLLQFVQWTELVVGILIVSGYFQVVALLILLPVSINIFLFHLFLAPPIYGPGLIILLLNILLLYPHAHELTKLFSL